MYAPNGCPASKRKHRKKETFRVDNSAEMLRFPVFAKEKTLAFTYAPHGFFPGSLVKLTALTF